MKQSLQRTFVVAFIFAVPIVSWTQSSREQPAVALQNGAQAPSPAVSIARELSVICRGDLLTISASNSTLSAILAEVSKCSGVKMDDSQAGGQTRFFETIGPGPIREVLSSLLDSTGLNYVIEDSNTNPHKVNSVMLLARADRSITNTSERLSNSSARGGSLREPEDPQDTDPTIATNASTPAETSPGEDQPASNPSATSTLVAPAAPSAVDSAPASPQMNLQDRIAEMQRLFDQRRQMVKDQNTHQH